MIAQLARPGFEKDTRLIREQGRQRVLATPRGLENVAAVDLAPLQIARLARHAELVFGAVVEGFQIGVGHGPVGERRICRDR